MLADEENFGHQANETLVPNLTTVHYRSLWQFIRFEIAKLLYYYYILIALPALSYGPFLHLLLWSKLHYVCTTYTRCAFQIY